MRFKTLLRARTWKTLFAFFLVAFAFRSAGCQFDITGNPDVNLVTVHVSPDSAAVPMGGQLTLTATVKGYLADGTVTWLVDGSNKGTIVANGLTAIYTAPGAVFPPEITIRVIPNEDPTRYVLCHLFVYPPADVTPEDTSFTVSPHAVRLLTGKSQQFTIDTVTFSTTVGPITWSLVSGPGDISATGVYTAPSTSDDSTVAVIRATSVLNPAVYSDARIILLKNTDSLLCFTRDVLPIVSGSCGMSNCHDAAKKAGGYDYNTYSGMIKSVKVGSARSSRMYTAMTQFNAASRMPPPPANALTPNQVLTIGKWINDGALDCQ